VSTELENPDMRPALTVVYVEDDERLAALTTRYLRSHGVDVHLVERGDLALEEIVRVRPDVVLLDLMLPGVDGLEVCRRVRERMHVPIVMVTARSDEADRVVGLEVGADDYVTKPFSTRELLARIRAQARRADGRAGPQAVLMTFGGLVIDASAQSATLNGRRLSLTSTEFLLLRVLAERARSVLSRERLLELVQGSPEEAFDRSIDVHISRLRRKLEEDPKDPRYLKTIRGAGYVFAPEGP